MSRALASFLKDQSAAAAAEMALVIPLLLVLMFTALEGAHYLYVEHQIVKGVRDGARYAARQPLATYGCTSATNTAQAITDATIKAAIIEVARTGQVAGGTPRVSTWSANSPPNDVYFTCAAVTTGVYATLAAAPRITVKAVVPYPSLFGALTGITTSFKVAAENQAPVVGL